MLTGTEQCAIDSRQCCNSLAANSVTAKRIITKPFAAQESNSHQVFKVF
jgi:hypothetical protein